MNDLEGWGWPKGGGICLHIADSLRCAVETNITLLKQLYPN